MQGWLNRERRLFTKLLLPSWPRDIPSLFYPNGGPELSSMIHDRASGLLHWNQLLNFHVKIQVLKLVLSYWTKIEMGNAFWRVLMFRFCSEVQALKHPFFCWRDENLTLLIFAPYFSYVHVSNHRITKLLSILQKCYIDYSRWPSYRYPFPSIVLRSCPNHLFPSIFNRVCYDIYLKLLLEFMKPNCKIKGYMLNFGSSLFVKSTNLKGQNVIRISQTKSMESFTEPWMTNSFDCI